MGRGWSEVFQVLVDTFVSVDDIGFMKRFESTDAGQQFAQQVLKDYQEQEAFGSLSVEQRQRHLEALQAQVGAARAASAGLYGRRTTSRRQRTKCAKCKGTGVLMCGVCDGRGFYASTRHEHTVRCGCNKGRQDCHRCGGSGWEAS
jgi:hypothetical protein